MRKLFAFNFMTVDGYFEGPEKGEYAWHKHDMEGSKYAADKLQSESALVFGRITYEQMVSFWPTEAAIKTMPEVAAGMNKAEKIVFSRTLKKAEWNNTTIIHDHISNYVRKLKNTPGKNLTILGSGSIITQLADEGLIDQFQFMIDPVAIGKGTPIFNGIKKQLNLELINVEKLKNNALVVHYKPTKQ